MVLTTPPVLPPLDGSLTIAEVIDFNSNHNSAQPCFVFSTDEEPEKIVTISHFEFSRACDHVTRAVREECTYREDEMVAIIALVDPIVYQAVIIGLMRTNLIFPFQPFPISHRNPPPAIVHLLRETDCHRVLSTSMAFRSLIESVKSELGTSDNYSLTIETIPDLEHVYPKLGTECADASVQVAKGYYRRKLSDVALYLHSSGSTGLPKAIPESYHVLLEWETMRAYFYFSFLMYRLCYLVLRSLSQYTPRLRIGGMELAPFHSIGIMIQIVSTIYTLIPVSLFPPVVHSQIAQPQIPSSDLVLEHMRRTKSNALIIISSLLEELAHSEEGLEMLKSCYLSYQLGNSLASVGVKIQSLYGATESGAVGIVRKDFDATEWIWIEFSESNIHWEPQGDETFECHYLTCDTHHPAIENMQDPRGYASSDFAVIPIFLLSVGRIDDVIIHSSGEKIVPTPIEAVLTTSPSVNGAVMFSSGRNQAGILIEPAGELVSDINEGDLAKLRNKLYLSATFLRLRIVGAVRKLHNTPNAEKNLSQNIIYTYPNIDKLLAYIAELVNKPECSTTTKSNATLIKKMTEKYSAGLGAPLSPSPSDFEGDKLARIVLLTGTTGHLGADILGLLLRDDSVERVYALNRSGSKSSLVRHQDRFKDKGLDPKLLNSEMLVLLEGNASQSNLGPTFGILIIHITWKVDFNLTLASFENNIQGTSNLIDMARSGLHASSLRNGPYPEEVVYDASTAVGGGYGESKYVAERRLAQSGLYATSLRLGQLCGGIPNGCWSTSDWFPIPLKSSLALSAIPVAAGVSVVSVIKALSTLTLDQVVTWVPMGTAAQAVLEVATSVDAPPVTLNLVHPRPISWKDMIELVRYEMAQLNSIDAASFRLIRFDEWMECLEKHSTVGLDEDTFHRILALKLIPFFRRMVEAECDMDRGHKPESGNLPNLSTHRMQNISKTLANLQPFAEKTLKRGHAIGGTLVFFD
ncbi:hypothetical protein BDQ12DRAFT_727427 [Crucibulum laeve]|uniref:Thioester reductase (TE) domain-containing protein n=1 Tax=Crucibulum laeve TaxID=68775 RepID=A0A5C3LNE5_9AGAR|nr:hypothetical protein BDQ12DRAFT_727427 [Crucibulum laeve]